MAGGAANGAFSAGAMWFLLQRLDACKKADEAALARCAEKGCSDEERRRLETDSCAVDRLQMAAGASTGSLISLVAKDYFAEAAGRRQRALDRIFQSYTCSVNSDLYCTTDSNLKELTQGEAKGLVRFDGLDRLLRGYIDQYTLDSPTEYFSSTVDFRTGRTLHLSSKDPEDVDDVHDLRQAVLSSVVEPGLSEPIFRIGEKQGVFIDGGVRSGLPMLDAAAPGRRARGGVRERAARAPAAARPPAQRRRDRAPDARPLRPPADRRRAARGRVPPRGEAARGAAALRRPAPVALPDPERRGGRRAAPRRRDRPPAPRGPLRAAARARRPARHRGPRSRRAPPRRRASPRPRRRSALLPVRTSAAPTAPSGSSSRTRSPPRRSRSSRG